MKTYMQLKKYSPLSPKKTLAISPCPFELGGVIISDSSLDPLVCRALASRQSSLCLLFVSPLGCPDPPPMISSQVAVCQLPSQIYLAIGDATDGKVWVNGIRLKCLWVFWKGRFLWPKALQETWKTSKCLSFHPNTGSHCLWHTPGQPQRVQPSVGTRRSLWNTGPCSPWARGFTGDTNDTRFMTLVHLIWWKYSENCLSI